MLSKLSDDATRQARLNTTRRAGGWVLMHAMASAIMMSIISSMAVDVGIYYTARTELERAADAAALAGAAVIQQGGTAAAAQLQAVTYAQSNPINGQIISSSAVSFTAGSWKNNTFTAGPAPYTAIQVKIQRSHNYNNPVTMWFSQIIGMTSIDIAATATARLRPPVPAYNIVGVNSASFASAGVAAQVTGRLVSNGDIAVGMPAGLNVGVTSDARSYNGTVRKGTLAAISGSQAPLTSVLLYPSPELPYSNNNSQIAAFLDGQNNFTAAAVSNIPGGVYVVNNLNFLAGVSVNLQGPVTFYVLGNFNYAVGVNLLGNSTFSAENFKVRVIGGGAVNFLATILTPVNMDLYAPDSDIVISVGLNQYKGRLIGKTLTVSLPLPGSIIEETGLTDPFATLNKVLVVH